MSWGKGINSVASCDAGRSSSLSALVLLCHRIVCKRKEAVDGHSGIELE